MLNNAVRYADPGLQRIADVLDAARLLRPIDRRRVDCGERWLKDPAVMAAAAERIAQACGVGPGRAAGLLVETVRTGELCEVDPVVDLGLGRPHFPSRRSSALTPALAGRCGCRGSGVRRACSPGAWSVIGVRSSSWSTS